jgi:hypothetical protein
MRLVYNLLSQKEVETNMGMGQDTRDDSSSTKAMATSRMISLAASAVPSFFAMAFFDGQARILRRAFHCCHLIPILLSLFRE